jgi:hypothetical protein
MAVNMANAHIFDPKTELRWLADHTCQFMSMAGGIDC